MTPVLSLRGLRAAYGPIEVLHGIDLDLDPGRVLAVLGPNGAGKSTLLSTIAGLHPEAHRTSDSATAPPMLAPRIFENGATSTPPLYFRSSILVRARKHS